METIDIPVFYKGQETNIAGEVLRLGYIYKIRVMIDEVPVFFERDEEGGYRAIVDPLTDKCEEVDIRLIQAIGEVLENLPAS